MQYLVPARRLRERLGLGAGRDRDLGLDIKKTPGVTLGSQIASRHTVSLCNLDVENPGAWDAR